MNSKSKLDKTRLKIFHEGRKRRIYVGELRHVIDKDKYEFTYDQNYSNSKNAIPIGPELSLFKMVHTSKKGELFSSFIDRIPSESNPAYKDYCRSQGISPKEKNPIILLGFIGKRGPSSFIFEQVYLDEFSIDLVVRFREELGISQHDFAEAFDINIWTLLRLESGKSKDPNTLKRLQIYFEFPDVAIWQLKKTGARIKGKVLSKLIDYFIIMKEAE
jgi:HipA-like protein